MSEDYTEITPGLHGRVLPARHVDGFDAITRQLHEGEVLYFVHDQGPQKVAVQVNSQAELDDANQQHDEGLSYRYQLVAARPSNVAAIFQENDKGPITVLGHFPL